MHNRISLLCARQRRRAHCAAPCRASARLKDRSSQAVHNTMISHKQLHVQLNRDLLTSPRLLVEAEHPCQILRDTRAVTGRT
eukprot:7363-Eustigmatos_ZCMA.PRE.1